MRSLVRRRAVGLAAVGVLAVAGCGDDSTGPGGPVATSQVSVQDNQFSPAAIVVAPGTTVTWTWTGANQHNVLFTDAQITDGPLQSSGTHATAMPMTAGTYAYACSQHVGMTGSVLVQ